VEEGRKGGEEGGGHIFYVQGVKQDNDRIKTRQFVVAVPCEPNLDLYPCNAARPLPLCHGLGDPDHPHKPGNAGA